MARKTVVAFSGGMDSTTLVYSLLREGDEVTCVNFSYGSKHGAAERQHAAELCRKRGIAYLEVDLPFINTLFTSALLQSGGALPKVSYDRESMAQTVVPGRNGIFLSILAGYAESRGAERIAYANHASDHHLYPDCRPEYVAAQSLAVFLGSDAKVRLYSPFAHLDKSAICRLGAELGVPFTETWSCYAGGTIHCGECGTCHERKQAFARAGMVDPTCYSDDV